MQYIPYGLSFGEGILTFFSPCLLPLLPVYFFYLAGTSDAADIKRGRLLLNSLSFVLGFTVVFTLLGATATTLGNFLQNYHQLLRHVGGWMMVLLGLSFIGIFKISLFNLQQRLDYDPRQLNLLKSLVFGMVFAFSWTPCIGPLLASALIMAGNLDTLTEGVILLLCYAAGLGIPFLLSAVLFDGLRIRWAVMQKYSRFITVLSGLALIVAGIMMITDHLF